MTKREMWQCDRCSESWENSTMPFGWTSLVLRVSVEAVANAGGPIAWRDLCPDCTAYVTKWIEGWHTKPPAERR